MDKDKKDKKNKKEQFLQGRPLLRGVQGTGKKREIGIGFDSDFFFGILTRAVSAVLAAVLVIYFGYHLIHMFTEDVSVVGVTSISQTETAEGVAWFIRDDRPLGGGDGYPYPVLADGSRAGKGEAVCRFYAADLTPVREEIAATDREIAMLRAEVGANVSSTGLKQTWSEASDAYGSLMKAVSVGDYASAASLSDSLREKFGRRTFISGGGNSLTAELSRLTARRSALLSSLGTPLKTVSAPESGYWFSSSDGLESAFGPSLAALFSEEAFNAAKAAEPGPVSAAGVFCVSSRWYLAVEFDGFDADLLEPDREYPVTAGSSRVVSMTLETKIRTSDGMLLLFSSDIFPSDFSWQRSFRVSVPVREYDGYRIPISAMRSYEGMTGVYTLNGGYVCFRRTEVLTEGPGYYLVASYEDAESGPPRTYEVLRRGSRSAGDGYIFVIGVASMLGLEREDGRRPPDAPTDRRGIAEILTLHYDDRGIPVESQKTYPYYYHLSALESVIVEGSNLYHGKVLN